MPNAAFFSARFAKTVTVVLAFCPPPSTTTSNFPGRLALKIVCSEMLASALFSKLTTLQASATPPTGTRLLSNGIAINIKSSLTMTDGFSGLISRVTTRPSRSTCASCFASWGVRDSCGPVLGGALPVVFALTVWPSAGGTNASCVVIIAMTRNPARRHRNLPDRLKQCVTMVSSSLDLVI